jgi:L-fuconolactonase
MIRVDAHCHFWELNRGDYDWLDVNNQNLAPIARDFQSGDLAAHRIATGINQIVVVQAAATEAETDYLLSLADRHEEIAGVVGWADLRSDKVSQRLRQWSRYPKFKGIRPMLQDIEDAGWLLEMPQSNIGQILVELGLRFDALIQPRHLPVLYQFCKDNPNLPVVIDHAAKPKSAFSGDDTAFEYWSENMKMLASDTNAYCKLSGLLTELDAKDLADPVSTITPFVEVLLKTFGPERLMWGSDWPVLTLVSNYQSWHDLAHVLLEKLGSDASDRVFGGTASEFYALGGAQ